MSEKIRQSIVVVLGHVDHGKTSLLDNIRKSSVAAREAGGITQSIGATVVEKSGKFITFLDTPGHAAFFGMRERGARLADIAILVVAADDGVKPQTVEAIQAIGKAKVPYVVAITKIDMPGANIESTLAQLEAQGVYFEKRGGDIPYIPLSSKTGEGIPDLIDILLLLSEVNDIKADPEGSLEAYVIENGKDKRGAYGSIVVKNGTLKVGDQIFIGAEKTSVRGIFNDLMKPIKQINPGEPGLVIGFDTPPSVGAKLSSLSYEIKLPDQKSMIVENPKLSIFIKARTEGSLEAILSQIPNSVSVVGFGVGEITESEVFSCKTSSKDKNSVIDGIFLFDLKPSSNIAKLAESERVRIESFNIIYRLFERLTELLMGKEKIIKGKAEIITSFPFDGRKVAGCRMLEGKFLIKDKLKLMRGETLLGDVRVTSLRKQKMEVKEITDLGEFGVLFTPNLDFAPGDVLLSVE